MRQSFRKSGPKETRNTKNFTLEALWATPGVVVLVYVGIAAVVGSSQNPFGRFCSTDFISFCRDRKEQFTESKDPNTHMQRTMWKNPGKIPMLRTSAAKCCNTDDHGRKRGEAKT